MITNSITYNNSIVVYSASGTGNMVVLLHGFGEDGTVWQNQIDFLKPHFRVIVPDIPGSGESAYIENAHIETYAEVIKLIIEAEFKRFPSQSVAGVSIIGHSLGGYITLAIAEKYPQYINSFGLFHSSAFADDEEKKETRRKAIDFIKANGAYSFLKTTIPTLFTTSFLEQYPDKIKSLIEEGKKFSDETLIQYYNAMIERPERTAILKNFTKSILFIIGEHDKAIPLQSSLQQCYIPLKSNVNILNHSAHMGLWEEKDKVNNILFNFLVNKF